MRDCVIYYYYLQDVALPPTGLVQNDWLKMNRTTDRQTEKSCTKSYFAILMVNTAKLLTTFCKMLLQPLIYWLLNHWAQCKSHNQHFHLTVIMVSGSFIAKLEHLLKTLLSFEKFSIFLVSLVLLDLLRLTRSSNATKLPANPPEDVLISGFKPPSPAGSPHTDSFHHRSGDGRVVCLRWLHKRRCVAAFQSETLSRL